VKVLIDRVFKVDKKGSLDTRLILSLRDLKFDDTEWSEAMDLISESIQISNSKIYHNFSVKGANGEFYQLSLNYSNY
jgi:hypothetical protein